MFERFTSHARQVIVRAQEEARRLDHTYIGTEHLLLGLLQEQPSVAARALADLGVTYPEARDEVERLVGRGVEAPKAHIPFTPRAKKVLELALREALKLGHNYIGTEHILLGLLREGDGVGAQVLAKQGLDADRVRAQVLLIMQTGSVPGSSMPASPGLPPVRATVAVQQAIAAAAEAAGSLPFASHHLLLAALRDPDNAATSALLHADVDVSALVAALEHASVEGTSDESPEERGRRHLSLTLDEDAVVIRVTDPAMVALAQKAWESRGFTEPVVHGDSDDGRPLSGLWLSVRETLGALMKTADQSTTLTIKMARKSTPRRARASRRK